MSAAATWSYTAKATHWALLDRDDWSGLPTFALPRVIDCDYGAKAERRTDAKGVEFVSRQQVFTEFADAKQGDYLLIGESSEENPITAGAHEIRAITRHADTFDRTADDFEIAT